MWNTCLTRLRRAQDGAIAVEFAMISVVLIATLVGGMEVGRLIWVQHTLDRATQEAARYAYTETDNTKIETRLDESLVGLDSADVTKSITTEVVDGATYKTIQVTYAFKPSIPLLPLETTVVRRSRVPQ